MFDEDVTNFTPADIVVLHSGAQTPMAQVSGDESNYEVDLSGLSDDGPVSIRVASGNTVRDFAGNALGASATSAAIRIDHTPPLVLNIVAAPDVIRFGRTTSIDVHTDEAVSTAALTVNGAPATPVVGPGARKSRSNTPPRKPITPARR